MRLGYDRRPLHSLGKGLRPLWSPPVLRKVPADIDVDSPDGEIRSDQAREQTASPAGRRELAGRLAGMTLKRQVLVLAMWPFMEQLLNFLVGFVDIALAARLEQAVAATNAIAVAGYVTWLMSLMHMAVGVGGTAIIARAVGSRNKRLGNTALGQALLLGVIWGAAVGLTVFFAAPAVGGLMGLQGESLEMCVTYLRIVATTIPFAAVLFVGNASLRGAGDTYTPFVCMVVVNIVNSALSVLFVYAPAPWGGHGVTGIAAGTALAWMLGSGITLYRLSRGSHGIRLRLIRLRPNVPMLKRIIRIGLPYLAESSGQWGGNFMVLKIVSMVAMPAAMGAHMIAIRLEAISYLPGAAIGTAAATLTGQYLGLGDSERARDAVRICWLWGAGIMGAMGLLFILQPDALVRIVTNEPELLEATPQLLYVAGWVQIFFGTYMVLSQAMRGAGATRATAILGNSSTFLVRLPLAYLLGIYFDLGLLGIWYGLCVELIIRGTGFGVLFLHGGWAKAKV